MFTVEQFFCPDGITPNSGLTGPNNIYIYGAFNKFPDFFGDAFKIVIDFENSVCYSYPSYEMTDQFL